jgi:hypothetical protein
LAGTSSGIAAKIERPATALGERGTVPHRVDARRLRKTTNAEAADKYAVAALTLESGKSNPPNEG